MITAIQRLEPTMITRARLILGLTMILVLAVAAACGDSDDPLAPPANGTPAGTPAVSDRNGNGTPEAPPDDGNGENGQNGDNGDTPAPPPSGVTGDGMLIVDGEQIAVEEVIRCEPFGEDEEDLDLTVLAGSVMAFVYITSFAGLQMHDMSIQGPAGIFEGAGYAFGGSDDWFDDFDQPLDGPPFQVSGNRVQGALVLAEAMGGDDTIEVTFDLPIPSNFTDCF